MRRAAKVDDNHMEMIRAARDIGASVADTSAMGAGFPDLVVGFRGVNYMFEIKDGSKSKSRQKLTKDQEIFHRMWRGQLYTVNNIKSMLDILLSGK